MRTSEAQRELTPSRCPVEGMINEFAAGVPEGFGVTGVTRLTETGALTGVTPLLTIGPLVGVVFTETISVPVCVPAGIPVGLASTTKSRPDGGSEPVVGLTLTSHVSRGSSEAVKGNEPSAKPG